MSVCKLTIKIKKTFLFCPSSPQQEGTPGLAPTPGCPAWASAAWLLFSVQEIGQRLDTIGRSVTDYPCVNGRCAEKKPSWLIAQKTSQAAQVAQKTLAQASDQYYTRSEPAATAHATDGPRTSGT